MTCLAAASDSCNRGTYQALDSGSNAGGAFADLMAGPFTWYCMQCICGPWQGKMPTLEPLGRDYLPPTYRCDKPAPLPAQHPRRPLKVLHLWPPKLLHPGHGDLTH